MGMDVYGKKPSTPKGEYFRASVWTWGGMMPILTAAAAACGFDSTRWSSNNGEGLRTQKQCDKLADAIEAVLNSGKPVVGEVPPWIEHFRTMFAVDTGAYNVPNERVLEFCTFLRACGGFEIH